MGSNSFYFEFLLVFIFALRIFMRICVHCSSNQVHKKGFFYILHAKSYIQRFFCISCKKTFSSRTFAADAFQHKPQLNPLIKKCLSEGMSMRSLSRVLCVNFKTIYRKFCFLSEQLAPKSNLEFQTLYFDEMETIEHTKCKPLSIALFVNERYEILSAQVAKMPCKGRLAELSIKKYGLRPDERKEALMAGLRSVHQMNSDVVTIITDGKLQYKKLIQISFPNSTHEVHSRKVKEKEKHTLHEGPKRKIHDPMFPLNHRCALLRDKINRLTRRSWCTTKIPENLQKHLNLFISYHNEVFV
jgi:transposase-like protein